MHRFTGLRSVFAGIGLIAGVTLGGTAVAQDASPAASPVVSGVTPGTPVTLVTEEGSAVAYGNVTQNEDGTVTITIATSADSGLTPGEHGVHLHNAGSCTSSDDEAFSDAGPHFNPTNMVHGGPDSDVHHAGDLGNLTVNDDGSFVFSITVEGISLDPAGENTLADADGTAIVIHQDTDDLTTDPSGESGGRVACGVVFPNTAPAASPVASPEASPVS